MKNSTVRHPARLARLYELRNLATADSGSRSSAPNRSPVSFLLSSVPGSMSWQITDQPESSLVKVLDDDALLKLLASAAAAALSPVSPDQATLVFANPADMKGFRLP